MIDIKLLRENPEKVKNGIAAKNADPKLVDKFLTLDDEWRRWTKEIDEKRAELNKASARFETTVGTAETSRRDFNRQLKERIKELEEKIKGIEKEREEILLKIPNL